MAKRNKRLKAQASSLDANQTSAKTQKQTELGRGTINHSAMGALVTSKIFSMRVVQAKKGKGSFNRKAKHASKECYQIAA